MSSVPTWAPSSTPSITTLSSIATTHASALESTLSAAVSTLVSKGSTIAKKDFLTASINIRAAEASLTIISAEEVLATATAPEVQSQATQAIWEATQNLQALEWSLNVYNIESLSRPANIIFLVIFAITFLYTALMLIKSRYHWYNVAFTCGLALEFIGFLGRVLSFGDMTNDNFFLLQLVPLTLAPAFLMGGIYFLFGQLIVIHGRQFSWLKPLHYSYIFISCDILSLVIQAGGGAQASIASQNYEDATPGTNVMIAGIAFQVFAMSIFIISWFIFWWKVSFKKPDAIPTDYDQSLEKMQGYSKSYDKKSISNFFFLMLNTKPADEFKKAVLEYRYNPKYASIRSRPLFNYYGLAISVSVLTIYIRCIYRVVELAQGFRGYLFTHEVFLMTLDATMIAIAAIIFVPFHPQIVLGSSNVIKMRSIKNNDDEVNSSFGDKETVEVMDRVPSVGSESV
ncbi:RTA3 [[Candida] subhashii]|uniref:Sphingoid long-chain base transporter RSB1 n=1 Tax=[Candida] subhashii TaxID=561895 RepID=A0A8J5UEN9_9ASCO|nr:RTA3 [[Candida] subhashii]KAG7661338.1 RTA3 [[Candida] subhashii]